MRNQVTLTISSIKGSRNYSLSKFLRVSFWIVASITIVLLVCSISLVIWLRSEVTGLEEKHKEVISKHEEFALRKTIDSQLSFEERESIYQDALAEQQVLLNVLRKEQGKVSLLNNALGRIEDLIGVDEGIETKDYEARLKLLEQTSLEKKFMLRSIPSGYPLKINRTITSHYGLRKHPNKKNMQLHTGIDFRAKPGVKIYATADGAVEFAGRHSSGYGNLIILNHSLGFRTIYAHLSRILVKSGQVVEKGHYIGLTGNSGITTGPHLHYEVTFIQRTLDPKHFVKWSLENYDELFRKERKVAWESLVKVVRSKLHQKTKQLSQTETISTD